ncbi:hypothetical protein PQR62_09495 [Herbaspirillum lusitanum]|jgi:hypothetical protein|uniref:DUF86 domain-containing protein n=1 Tax=Herbaspirillum lusitanum TaxID=213312 RepID=A0ABW9A8G5_9BURK
MNDKPGAERQTHAEWEKDLEAVDLEIVRLAIICQVRLLDPGIISHVLDDQAWVCGTEHPNAFKSLRGLLFLHYDMQQRMVESYGKVDTAEIVLRVREHLAPRISDQLGSLS